MRNERYAATVSALAVATVRDTLLGEARPAEALLRSLTDDSALIEELSGDGACFVTLKRRDTLRGCIGSLLARRALYRDIVANTRRAMQDPRMRPVDATDWPELTVSVAVLSPPQPLAAASFEELYAALRPGVDGVTLWQDDKRATFLPSVWASLPRPRTFVAALLRKGGWRTDDWPAGLRVERYGTEEFISTPPRPGLESE